MTRAAPWLLVVAILAGRAEAAMDDLASGTNRFAVELHARLRDRPGNLVFAPASIASALAMAQAGAAGPTADEMARTLHLPADAATADLGFAALRRLFDGDGGDRPYQLDAANALWGQRGLAYKPGFLRRAEAAFGASLREVDFLADPQAARREINAWVEDRTRSKIKDLLGPADVDTSTDLVLTDAVYFQGAWSAPFPKARTVDEAFGDGRSSRPVPMMHQVGTFGYFEADDRQGLLMPYVGGDLSAVVLLPRKPDGLPALEASLTAEAIADGVGRATRRAVDVALPRFRLDSSIDLAKVLAAMGMPTAFGPDADFSGIVADRRLRLSAAVHKAYLEFNEAGAEAAAATGLGMRRSLAFRPPEAPVVFRADRPFLVLIRDDRSGSILFLGRVVDPSPAP